MKNILKSLLTAGILFATVGCSKDQIQETFNPEGENAAAAYFTQKNFSQEFATAATGNQTLLVDVYRQNNSGDFTTGFDLSVPGDAAEVVSIPENITFLDGEYKTVLPITVRNVEALSKGTTYTLTIKIGDFHEFVDLPLPTGLKATAKNTRAASTTKYTTLTVSFALTLDWEPVYILKDMSKLLEAQPVGTPDADWFLLDAGGKKRAQTAAWVGGGWRGMEGGIEKLPVQRAAGTDVFRMQGCGEGGVDLIFTVDRNPANKITVNGSQYFRCVMTAQTLAVDLGDGDVYVSDFPSYTGTLQYQDRPCYWDNKNGFYFTLYYHIPGVGGYNADATAPTDLFLFDTGAAADPKPAVEIEYIGLKSSETGIKTHEIAFAPNADAASYIATTVNVDGKTEEQIETLLADIHAQILAGTYKGVSLNLKDKDQRAWDMGTVAATFAAVSFSSSANEKVEATNYILFNYNPDGDSDAVKYTIKSGAGGYVSETEVGFTNPANAFFGDNSVNVWISATDEDITAVKYALLTKAEFDAAGLSDTSTEAELGAYVEKNGRSYNAAALKEVNTKATPNVKDKDGYSNFFAAKASTEYRLITNISNPDATKTEVQSITTEATGVPTALKATLSLKSDDDKEKYTHTHVFATFEGEHIIGGNYALYATNDKTLGKYIEVDAAGKATLKLGVSKEDVLELIATKTAFTSGPKSDLLSLNNGKAAGTFLAAAPATRYILLAAADHDGDGAKEWTYSVITTDFAPAVTFTQTATAVGKNMSFNWKSADKLASIFKTTKVVYAMVTKSELAAAGVDLANITELNDFEARLAAATTDAEKAAINAQKANAEKVLGVLALNAKVFQGDAAMQINTVPGVSKQFANLAAGDYALISQAHATHNTKLSVSIVTIP